jgi:hypothetical protein
MFEDLFQWLKRVSAKRKTSQGNTIDNFNAVIKSVGATLKEEGFIKQRLNFYITAQ